MVTLDQLVPQGHLVRKGESALDFSFIYDLVKDVYSEVVAQVLTNFLNLVDWRGGHETPTGLVGQVRPHRRVRRGGSPPTPRKASAWERKSTGSFTLGYQLLN